MARRFRLAIGLLGVALCALPAPARADQMLLSDVPAYYWHFGCSPTMGMMLLGYWDTWGHDALIPGSADWGENRTAIREAIASKGDGSGTTGDPGTTGSGHVADYAYYGGVSDASWDEPNPDMSELDPDNAHADDCLADFMETSRSDNGLHFGATWTNRIGPGLENYAAWRGEAFISDLTWGGTLTWDAFTEEIGLGRPVHLSVDSNGDGSTDHSVAAIGFRDINGYEEYACWDTWSTSTIRWRRFRPADSDYTWGVSGMDTLYPGNTGDCVWRGGSGSWHTWIDWHGGRPGANDFVAIGTDGQVSLTQSGSALWVTNRGHLDLADSLTVSVVRNEPEGLLSLSGPDAALTVQQNLRNAGSIHVAAGTLSVSGDLQLVLGSEGAGHVTQSGGAAAVSGTLRLDGAGAEESGSRYEISSGQLTVGQEIEIGQGARLDWLGGSIECGLVAVNGTLGVGFDTTLAAVSSGDVLDGGGEIAPAGGSAPGTIAVVNGATVAHNSGAVALPRVQVGDASSGGTLAVSGDASLAYFGAQGLALEVVRGQVGQTGGSVGTVPGTIGIRADGASALYDLQAGNVTALTLTVEGAGSTFRQSGGEATVTMLELQGGSCDLSDGLLSITTADIQAAAGPAVLQTGGSLQADQWIYLQGDYELQGGDLTLRGSGDGRLHVGLTAAGSLRQSGGLVSAREVLIRVTDPLATGSGSLYELSDGEFLADRAVVGDHLGSSVNQTGGAADVASLEIGQESGAVGSWTLADGSLTVGEILLGGAGQGSLAIASASATVEVRGLLRLGAGGSVTATEGTRIRMTGAAFENQLTNGSGALGLGELEMVFEGGETLFDPFEVASRDLGPVLDGFDAEFALGALTLGGQDVGQVELLDLFDNRPDWVGNECLYVRRLTLGAGSSLDLNGLTLYYLAFEDLGGTIDLNGGSLVHVPAGSLPGDANADGLVSDADYTIWADNYGSTKGTWETGDFNGDALVSDADYTIWADHYGQAAGDIRAVPAPTTLLCLVLGASAAATRRRD